jgi:hypothetical protein
MQFYDRLALDAPKRTKDGFLAVRAKAARAGIYEYTGAEVDPEGKRFAKDALVKVYRPADEVFAPESVGSFFAKPITNDHPSVPVTADNWKQHARGAVMGAMRDGEYLAFDLALLDAAAIKAVDSGKRELSNGYSCDLDWTAGVADGQSYDAIQRNIRGNHVAIVDKGRAGPDCKIGDASNGDASKITGGGNKFAACDANPGALPDLSKEETKVSKTITVDGLPVNLGDVAAVEAVLAKKDSAIADSAKALDDEKAKVATLTAEKTALEKQVADAKAVDMDKLVADRAELVAKAKALKTDLVTDGKSADDIRKEVVAAKLGDAAKDFDAKQNEAAFAVISADAKVEAKDDKKVVSLTPRMTADAAAASNIIRNARYA